MRWYEWPFSNVLNIATNWPQNGRCVASCSRSSMLRFGSMQTVCSPMEKRSPPVCQSRSCNPIASLCWLTAAAAATTKRRRLTRRTLLSVDGGAAATFCMRPRISGQHLRVVEIYTHACGSVIPYWIILHGCPVAEWWRPVNFFLILHIRSMDQQRERKRLVFVGCRRRRRDSSQVSGDSLLGTTTQRTTMKRFNSLETRAELRIWKTKKNRYVKTKTKIFKKINCADDNTHTNNTLAQIDQVSWTSESCVTVQTPPPCSPD